MMPVVERQELHCHNCNNYVQFDIDMSLNGNHVLNCPVCGHEHCRVVKDGVITEDRWDQRNGSTYHFTATNISYSASSTFTTYSYNSTGTQTTAAFLYNSWLNTY